MRRRRRGQAGFTMIEVMIVCAIIAILAAVVIPSWMKESRKGKFDPEVRAMFSEIAVKEEQYKSENAIAPVGVYATASTCPATVSAGGVDFLAQPCYTGAWVSMRMTPTDTKIRCTYTVATGVAPTNPVAVPATPAGFTLPSNAATFSGPWYSIVAECDMDGQGGASAAGTNTTFFTASWDTQTQKLNYGQ